MSHTGGCLCGAITYEFPNDPAAYGVCHCLNCQKQAGSAFSTLAPVPKSEFNLNGEPKLAKEMYKLGKRQNSLYDVDDAVLRSKTLEEVEGTT